VNRCKWVAVSGMMLVDHEGRRESILELVPSTHPKYTLNVQQTVGGKSHLRSLTIRGQTAHGKYLGINCSLYTSCTHPDAPSSLCSHQKQHGHIRHSTLPHSSLSKCSVKKLSCYQHKYPVYPNVPFLVLCTSSLINPSPHKPR
jgi:hypothetical protein